MINDLSRFGFVWESPQSGVLLVGEYAPGLVVLSVVVTVVASYVALTVAQHAQARNAVRWLWSGLAALSMGVGVWAMHFIGMLAFSLPGVVEYDMEVTLLSILPTLVAGVVAFRCFHRLDPSGWSLLAGGVVLGCSIGGMHYVGMAAYLVDGTLRYGIVGFGVAVAVAVVLAIAALWVQARLARVVKVPEPLVPGLAALLMGAAASAMHYMAMESTWFISDAQPRHAQALTSTVLALYIAIVTGLLVGLVLMTSLLFRQRQLANRVARREQRMRRILEATQEGFMLTDGNGVLLTVNPAFVKITGFSEAEVLGKTPAILKSGRHNAGFYQEMWRELAQTGLWQGEVWNRRKSGEVFPQRLSISALYDGDVVQNYAGVFADISHIKQAEEALARLAHYDPLTNLPNRALMAEHLVSALDRAKRQNTTVGVMMLDLDGFKTVNDSLGHPAGDMLLQVVASRLCGTLRKVDTVARLGGDEFGVVVEAGLGDLRPGVVAQKIIEAVGQAIDLDGHVARVTASIGIAMFPEDGQDPTQLIKAADTAMYVSKQSGRNAWHFHHPKMSHAAEERLALERGLRSAIDNGELELWYQPQWAIGSGVQRIGAESLVRWRSPTRGLVPPDAFIPLAEETGLILPLGEWVLRKACQDARRWMDAGLDCGVIAVNVAGLQIERGDFYATVKKALEDTGLPPAALCLEVTESFLLRNAAQAMEVVGKLSALGVQLAIDDFGTGYSSLAYLKNLRVNKLKVDKGFVRELPHDTGDVAITRAVIALGQSLGFRIVAEGVESLEQLEFLRAQGCEECQGYYLSKPRPTAQYEDLLKTPAH